MEPPSKTPASRYAEYDRGGDRPLADPMERHGSEWGLASLITGCMLFLGAIAFLHLDVTTREVGVRHFYRTDISIILILHVLFTALVTVMNLITICAAVKAWASSNARGQPAAYGVMAFLVSCLAFGLWICAIVGGFATMLGISHDRYW